MKHCFLGLCLLLFGVANAQLQPFTTTELRSLQTNPCPLCLEVLKDGLEEELNIRKGQHFNQDLKTFFTSDKFLEEYKNGKWQGDVGIVVDGAPIDFGFGKSDEEIRRIQERIRTATSIQTNSGFYESYRKNTKNTALAQIYVDCLIKVCREDDNLGLNGLASFTKRSATFIITYRDRGGRPARVNRFEITSGSRRIANAVNIYRVGDNLQPERKITCVRNPKEDLVLTLSTSAGDETLTIASEDDQALTNNQMPVGTIIASYLNFEQFNAATANNERNPYKIWSDVYSNWAPCDGRSVEYSTLRKITGETTLPDLRGVFLRGLNTFDPNERTSVPQDQKDPDDTRKAGSPQKDALQNHKHEDTGHTHESDAISADNTKSDNNDQRDVTSLSKRAKINPAKANIGPAVKVREQDADVRTDVETRPKNVAIYYYIRIN